MNPASQEPSPRKTYRLMAGVAVAMIVLIGIAIYSLSQLGSVTPGSSLKAPVINATLRQNLPQFEYTSERKSLNPQNFEGQWTLLTFWAYWCAPCLEEMPTLNRLYQGWQGPQLEILTVNTDTEMVDQATQYLTDESIVLPTVFDKKGVMKQAFGVSDVPRHFLINPQGKIVWQEKGAFQWDAPSARDQLMKIMETESAGQEVTEEPAPESEPESEE